jgi:hypothetical protein
MVVRVERGWWLLGVTEVEGDGDAGERRPAAPQGDERAHHEPCEQRDRDQVEQPEDRDSSRARHEQDTARGHDIEGGELRSERQRQAVADVMPLDLRVERPGGDRDEHDEADADPEG